MPLASRARAVRAITAGRRTVIYRDTTGNTFDAVVLGAGAGADQLNLKLPSYLGGGGRSLTNVDKATSLKQTNVWYLPGEV